MLYLKMKVNRILAQHAGITVEEAASLSTGRPEQAATGHSAANGGKRPKMNVKEDVPLASDPQKDSLMIASDAGEDVSPAKKKKKKKKQKDAAPPDGTVPLAPNPGEDTKSPRAAKADAAGAAPGLSEVGRARVKPGIRLQPLGAPGM
mmetsp:Transcript_48364/g.110094  ORF Transcript_48364/g.110094 Transcript_48364/m.110094 type:complete len:148 (+) Transcript_48364:43-486(+)